MADIPHFTLNDGNKIPSVGIGCWMGIPGGAERVYNMCLKALKNGYRLIDTANGYVGQAVRDSGIPREDIYVTTKLPNNDHHRVQESFDESLRSLGLEYIDLYLMHWPQACISAVSMADPDAVIPPPGGSPTFIETWQDMEKLLTTGKVRSIGISNFSVKTLNELLPHCHVVPAVNQVELHPCLPSVELKKFCNDKGILLEAYSPLGQKTALLHESPIIRETGERLGATTPQVVLSWGVQRGTVVIAKTETESRMKDNITLVQLSKADMETLNEMHKLPGLHRSLVLVGDTEEVFGWKYEWLGWDIGQGGFVP
ncbi:aldo/keto reductase [Pleurotus eryngii]|uniref:Aldo/keto reductase n=1 Tax=Pleurotus eryngii TaxID=5323 RepID=A0A9P6DCE1_PLEER|nr:aldo/keto reductase [Pleurotus eryngii]